MNHSKLLALGCTLAVLLAVPASAHATRQFYGKTWVKHTKYYYRQYYYKPVEHAPAYRYSLVIYYPKQPRYYYYYNPYIKKYTGRFDRQEKAYSLLPEADQKETIAEIKPDAFPKPGPMPTIPGASDTVQIEEPPPGLPPDESAELTPQQMGEVVGKAQGTADGGEQPKGPPQQAYTNWCRDGSSYYSSYYYQPVSGGNYHCHRCQYYPSQPRYVYYYNPYKSTYWGRYDLQAKGYSLLAEKDRKGKLEEIPPSAFPTPGQMPTIPEAKAGPRMNPPPAVVVD